MIAYYSWSNGNTERIAKMLQQQVGGDHLETPTEQIEQWIQQVKALL